MKQSRRSFGRNQDSDLETQRMTTRLREKSPVVSLTKYNALLALQRQTTRLDSAKRGIVAGIEVDQRLLYRRFQRLLSQTRLKQAQMDGNRTLERELRRERLIQMGGRAAMGCDAEWDELEKVLHGTHLSNPKGDLPVRNERSLLSVDSIRKHSSAPPSAWIPSKFSIKSSAATRSTTTPLDLKTVCSAPVALFNGAAEGQVKANSEDLDSEEDDMQQPKAVLEKNGANGQPSIVRRQMTSFATPHLIQTSSPPVVSHLLSPGATEEDVKHGKLLLIEMQLKRVREATDDCLRRVHGFYAKLGQCSDSSAFDNSYAKRFSKKGKTIKGLTSDSAELF